MDCTTPCNDVVELKAKLKSIERDIREVKDELKTQDLIIRDNDKLISKVLSNIENISTQLKEIKESMNSSKKQSSDRNWALWMLIFATVVSLIINIFK